MPLGKLRRRWKDEINTQLGYIKKCLQTFEGRALLGRGLL
jgi:hypothetical protein